MTDDSTLPIAFAELSSRATYRDDCPAPSVVFEAAAGTGVASTRVAVVEHTVKCGACAESWRLASALQGEAGEAPVAARSGFSRYAWGLLAAAAVVAAVALPLLRTGSGDRNAPAWRSEAPVTIESLLSEQIALPRDQFLLRWTEPAPGARYSVTVGSDRLEPLASRDNLDRTEFLVPAGALQSLPDGASVLWRVQARLPDGRTVASPTFIARLP